MEITERIDAFLAAEAFGVVGASTNRDKYGNKVLRCYQQNQRKVLPVNPVAKEIEGVACVASVSELPQGVNALSVITPPAVTEQVVAQAAANGVKHIWMQPGAQSAKAIADCEAAGINVIADGSCLLVVLGYHEG
ncbi:MAG: CoA-binding protein [Desulfuromonadales bacterium]|nr:CoA-binding protein [Desulfuromonadales bacterium]